MWCKRSTRNLQLDKVESGFVGLVEKSKNLIRNLYCLQFRLVCMAVYTDADGERKYLPQYFKFLASNPLSVRTKVHMRKSLTDFPVIFV